MTKRVVKRRALDVAANDLGMQDESGKENENESGRADLKALIKLGTERGFVIRGEISDCLPERLAQPDAIENVVRAFSEMGIAVFEQAPDAESMIMNDHPAAVATDEQIEEEAVTAISSVDAEFGRTTDPVRMYMREMGTTELLTRQGEIALAQRIEEGRNGMIRAISSCPATIAEILAIADGVACGETAIDEFVDGLVDPAATATDDMIAVPEDSLDATPMFDDDQGDEDDDDHVLAQEGGEVTDAGTARGDGEGLLAVGGGAHAGTSSPKAFAVSRSTSASSPETSATTAPLRITRMRSARPMTSSNSEEIRSTATPSEATSRMSS